jgi:hypothetical protein
MPEAVRDSPTFCSLGGVIGGAESYRPVEPWERGWGSPLAPVLCSHIRCAACSEPVRAVLGHALPEGPSRSLDFAGRLKPLPELLGLVPSPRARTWVCACRAVSLTRAEGLNARPAWPWRCAGHPPRPAEATLDGHPLPGDPVGWFAHLDALMAGVAPPPTRGRSVHDARHPGFQLAHRVVHLTDGRLQRALGERVSRTWLPDGTPRARVAASDFFRLLPRFFGWEALVEALGRLTPATPPGEAARLRLACVSQLQRASDPALLLALQRDLLRPRGPAADADVTADGAALGDDALEADLQVLQSLARHTRDWLKDSSPTLAALRPDLRATLAHLTRRSSA